MRRFSHVASSSVMLAKALSQMVKDDPRNFAYKVKERIRLSRVSMFLPKRLLWSEEQTTRLTKIEELFSEGAFQQLSALGSSSELQKLSRSDRRKVSRATERWELLHSELPDPGKGSSNLRQSRLQEELLVTFFLTNSLPYTQSGYTFRSHEMAKAMSSAGVNVKVVTRFGYPLVVGQFPIRPVDWIDGIRYRRQLTASYPSSLRERNSLSVNLLLDEIRCSGTDIIHTTTDYNNALVAASAAVRSGLPWVYEVRGELENTWLSRHPRDKQEQLRGSDFYKAARMQEVACMNAANAVITLSEVSRSQLIARGVEPSKIHVIPNAVDESLVGKFHDRHQLRRELGINDNGIVVGTVTSVVGYEGLDILIRAAVSAPNIYVVIVGDGTATPQLERLALELGMQDRIMFAGRRPNADIWKWYGSLDAFVLPRKNTEVCRTVTPIKALIAQALGVPVIGSDLPAIREVTGGIECYVEPESVESLTAALLEIQPDQPRNSAAIAWARSRTWSENARKLSRIYRDLL